MHIIAGIIAIVGGLLCMPGIYVRIKKNVLEINRPITYVQGILGFFICLSGIFFIVHSYIISINWLSMGRILYWLSYNITGIFIAVVGFLVGFGMIQYLIIDKVPEDMKIKAQTHVHILINVQIPLGVISIILGVLAIIFNSSTYRF